MDVLFAVLSTSLNAGCLSRVAYARIQHAFFLGKQVTTELTISSPLLSSCGTTALI